MLNFEFDNGSGNKVGHASFRDRRAICTRLRMEKQWENGTKQVTTGKNSTSGYGAAKLNFELVVLAIQSGMPIFVVVAQFARALEWKNSAKTGQNT